MANRKHNRSPSVASERSSSSLSDTVILLMNQKSTVCPLVCSKCSMFLCCESWLIFFNIVLHPSLKARYFKANKWPQDWQDEAVEITRRIFDEDYKSFGGAKDIFTSSVDVLPIQNNYVSEANTSIIMFLLTLPREIPFVQQCVPRWGNLEVPKPVTCATNSTSGWPNLWSQLKIHSIGGLQIRSFTLVFLAWRSMSMRPLVSSCLSFSSATTYL